MDEKEEFGCASSCDACQACCSHDHEFEDGMELDLEDGILTFTDEEGNDVDFQILDAITVDEKQYLVVMSCEDEEESGVVILEINEEDGEEVYDTVIDDEVAEKVFEEFKKANNIE